MAIQGRKKIKTVTIDNRNIPQGKLKTVKETKMPEVTRRKKVLSRERILPIIDFTVFIINKRAVTMTWNWLKSRLKEPSTYQGVTAITPNQVEAESAAGTTISTPDGLNKIKTGLLDRLQCRALLITLGEKGMCLIEEGQPPLQIPARAREVYDVSGAGDTVIAVFTTALVAGATLREAALLSNLAGGMVVEKLGTATVTREELMARLPEIIS